MVCPSHLFGRDVDDVFSYSTIKYVQIRDRRLGLTKLLLTLAVSGYVGLYSLWYEGFYLEKSPLTGACRFTLQQPTQGNCDPTDPGCLNDYGSPADAPYCAQSALPYAGNKRTCEFYEQIGAQQTMDSSLLVSTRITTLEQRLVCNATHGPATCPQVYDVASERTNYVMAAERFTVLIDHSVLATSIRHLQGTSSALSGRLYVKKSHALCEEYGGSVTMRGLVETKTAPCYIRPNTTSRGLDFFSLDVLLRADDVSLDDVSYDGKTYRETGASLIFEITYQNFRGWPGVGEIFYSYTPMVVRGSSYKYYDAIYAEYRERRHLLNQHGIYVEAVQGGELRGRGFSFNNLLIQLTTSLTLFATATVLTDFLAIYVLPDRNHYNDYKYEIQASDLYRPPDDPDAAPDPARRSADGAITDWHDEA
ncbi:ATP P2X receptor [Aureococcus anophagefferens]|nr:ATP P2X receptor [Aureococcus anophagefferens]